MTVKTKKAPKKKSKKVDDKPIPLKDLALHVGLHAISLVGQSEGEGQKGDQARHLLKAALLIDDKCDILSKQYLRISITGAINKMKPTIPNSDNIRENES
mgnify:CR=1 FL=1